MYLAAKRYLRQHPDATDEQVAEACGIHRVDIAATVEPARRDVVSGT